MRQDTNGTGTRTTGWRAADDRCRDEGTRRTYIYVCTSDKIQNLTFSYTYVCTSYIPTRIVFVNFWCLFAHTYLFVRAPCAETLKGVDRGRPSGHGRRGLGSIRAVCCAWRALKIAFRREWIRRFPGFLFEALVCTRNPPFFEMLVFFAHTYLYENGTTCHNSGFPVQGQVWGTFSFKFGCAACRVPCVTRACAVCNAMLFFSKKKKQAAGPSSLVISAISLFDFLDDVVILQSSCYLRLRLTIQGGLM